MDKKYSICIGDNHAIFREGIKALLAANPRFEVIAEGEDGLDVTNAVREFQPDLVLLDLTMPKMNGLDVIKSLKKRFQHIKIIVLTLHNKEEYIHSALKSGADGYVLKDSPFSELELAIEAVFKDQIPLSPGVSETIVASYLNKNQFDKAEASWDRLTKREREHLKLIAEAYSNKEIAEYLNISVKTVEKHRANLKKKLALHNAAELTAFAIKNGLIET